jgi:hypothetical protein
MIDGGCVYSFGYILVLSIRTAVYTVYDGVRTAQLGAARAGPPRAAARARNWKLGEWGTFLENQSEAAPTRYFKLY